MQIKKRWYQENVQRMPIFKCETEVTEATNYLIMALTAYKAAAEVVLDTLLNVTIVCQIIKPLIKQKLSWNHQAIFTLIRSASNIFLMQLLGEFYDLKSKLLESRERIIHDIQGKTIEEKMSNIINWFMHNEVADKPKKHSLLQIKTKGRRKG